MNYRKHRRAAPWTIQEVVNSLHYDPTTGNLHDVETTVFPSFQCATRLRAQGIPMTQWRKHAKPSELVRTRTVNPLPIDTIERKTGAVLVYRGGAQFYAHHIAWLMIYGKPADDGINHVNGNKADNRPANLESLLDFSRRRAKRYRARVRESDRLVHLGYFATREERDAAVFAYRLGITPIK